MTWRLAVEQARRANRIIDAIGPRLSLPELAQQIGLIIGKPRPIVSVPPPWAMSSVQSSARWWAT
jgi:uncharacterized protein YbjT (DUF2867 family)